MNPVVIPPCPECWRQCPITEPSCHRGRFAADEFWNAPVCPGCHIGCSLALPQCARGIKFREKWEAGEEIPERRMPGMGGPGGPGKGGQPGKGGPGGPGKGGKGGRPGPGGPGGFAMDPDRRLSMLLTGIVPRVIGGEQDPKAQVLACLQRQDGAMTYEAIPERVRIATEEIYRALEQLMEEGLVVREVREWGSVYYWITEEGEAAAKAMGEAEAQATKERFACLTDEEKTQLGEMLDKLLKANMPQR